MQTNDIKQLAMIIWLCAYGIMGLIFYTIISPTAENTPNDLLWLIGTIASYILLWTSPLAWLLAGSIVLRMRD